MQSSVRSEPPPRLGDLPRTFSNDSVHMSKEVSITSSRAPTPPVIQRSMYSPMPPSHVQRPATSGNFNAFGASEAQVRRWNSEKSSISQITSTMRRRSSVDPDLLESNRESMKALSDFLMTREPPPTNWVSMQSSDDDKSFSSLKRSAYKLFGKSKKKKSKEQKLLQLPDSAVAARTSRGARHIAISIPLVHDHMDIIRSDTPRLDPRQGKRERTDRGAVHVLKPLHEVRESGSSYLGSPPRSSNGPVVIIPEHMINPLGSHPPDEVLRQSPTLGGTYLNYKPQPRIEPSNAPRHDFKNKRKSYVVVSPTAMQGADSQLSMDPRHSGGTMYSTISIAATPQAGHSRQPSSVSTAPSATATSATILPGLKLDLPPRNSSISKVPKAIQAELAQSSSAASRQHLELSSPPNSPLKPGNESLNSGGSSNSPPLVVVGTATAEMVRKYSGAGLDGPTLVHSITPRSQLATTSSSPPPNKSLPDLPAGARGLTRPRTAPPPFSKSKEAATRSRQERVKERKFRDIEALRSSTSSTKSFSAAAVPSNIGRAPLSESNTTNGAKITTPPRNPKRNGLSSAERRRLANSVSPVMVVVDLEPIPIPIPSFDDGSGSGRRHKKTNSSTSTIRPREKGMDREPDSPTSPSYADFPSIPSHHSSRSLSLSPPSPTFPSSITRRGRTQSLRSSVLDTRMQERRVKINVSLRERELDERLGRIERDNEILIRTLSGIARSFGGLGRVLEREDRSLGDRDGVDGEMRALQRRVGGGGGEERWVDGEV